MTKQEYLDLVVTTSRNGGFPSIVRSDNCELRDPNCLYRSDNGKKCVAGLLIPDDKYSEVMEGQAIDTLIEECSLFSIIPHGMTLPELVECQELHDDNAGHVPWPHDEFVDGLLSGPFKNMRPTTM